MAHVIEVAKSSRARCRTCRQGIAKGELRFGEEAPNAFAAGEMTLLWHHLKCAAKSKPKELKEALAAYPGEIPDRAELEKGLDSAAAQVKPGRYPYVERAPTGRSKCIACEAEIEKGALRVAIEREVDAGGFMRKGAGYLHPGCAPEHLPDLASDELVAQLKENSPGLSPADLDALAKEI